MVHNSLLNITVVAFKVFPLGSYAPILTSKQLWNLFCGMAFRAALITPDIINVIKMPTFQCFLYLREQKKRSLGARSGE
jgi:hypothetical protein